MCVDDPRDSAAGVRPPSDARACAQEDWRDVQLSLMSGLPVSFVHDLYTPRYKKRQEVRARVHAHIGVADGIRGCADPRQGGGGVLAALR